MYICPLFPYKPVFWDCRIVSKPELEANAPTRPTSILPSLCGWPGVNLISCTTVYTYTGWWFVNVDDFHEGWVPATYLDPLYGSEDISIQRLDVGEGK